MDTNQKLTEEKLELEIEILKVQLEEKLTPPRKSWLIKTNEWIKKWSITILTLASVIGGIWGVIIPIKSYYEEQEKKLKYDLNTQMIELVNDLSGNKREREQAIMMLQYYEMNALDILIFRLENSSNEKKAIAEAINNIYQIKGHQKEILRVLFKRTNYLYDKIVESGDIKLGPVLALVFVLDELETTPKDQKAINDFTLNFMQRVVKEKNDPLDRYEFLLIRLSQMVLKRSTFDTLFKKLESADKEVLVDVLIEVICNDYKLKKHAFVSRSELASTGKNKILEQLCFNMEAILKKSLSDKDLNGDKLKSLFNYVNLLDEVKAIATPENQKQIKDFVVSFIKKVPKTESYNLLSKKLNSIQ